MADANCNLVTVLALISLFGVDSGHAMKCRESWVIEGSSEDDGGEVKLVED